MMEKMGAREEFLEKVEKNGREWKGKRVDRILIVGLERRMC